MEGSQDQEEKAPAAALAAVLKHSSALPAESAQVRGYDFNRGVDYRALLGAYSTTGFQATNFGRAVQQVNAMVRPGAGLPGRWAWPSGARAALRGGGAWSGQRGVASA